METAQELRQKLFSEVRVFKTTAVMPHHCASDATLFSCSFRNFQQRNEIQIPQIHTFSFERIFPNVNFLKAVKVKNFSPTIWQMNIEREFRHRFNNLGECIPRDNVDQREAVFTPQPLRPPRVSLAAPSSRRRPCSFRKTLNN